MLSVRRIGVGVVAVCLSGIAAVGQQPAPLADRTQQPLLPGGISEHGIHVSGGLAYIFKDESGTDILHVIGEFSLMVGEGDGQELRSREAAIWITRRQHEARSYQHLQVLLWQDAEILEVGGTITSGPALFVSLNILGEIRLSADDIAYRRSVDERLYQEGAAIRQAIVEGKVPAADESVALRVYDASGLTVGGKKSKARPTVYLRSQGNLVGPEEHEGNRVITITGGVYLSRGIPGDSNYLEIRADSAVLFLPPVETAAPGEKRSEAGLGVANRGGVVPGTGVSQRRRSSTRRQLVSTGLGDEEVEAVYLEGDVSMSQGLSFIRASRLYYDPMRDKALILDAIVRTTAASRQVPLYLRADEIRQISANQFAASSAKLTTSEFHTPHYHVGASHIELTNRTPPTPSGRPGDIRAGSFRIRDATLNLGGFPVLYWPFIYGGIDTSETANRTIRSGFSDDFGLEWETKWHLFNVLGLEVPEGFDATLSLDFFSERGPAAGIDAEYERTQYFGLMRSYVLNDDGKDFLGRKREDVSAKDRRGRALLRHRQYLRDDWSLSLELSYISDRGFLEEFFESEFDNDKEQETLIYLKQQRDNWALTGTLQWRILDFTTQTERLPDVSYHRIGEPLEGVGTWFSENRLGAVRLRPGKQTFRELLFDGRAIGSDITQRADSRQELDFPLDCGPLRIVPFVSLRASAWNKSLKGGSRGRVFATYGLRSSMYLTHLDPDYESELFDIHGLRHVVKPDITAWVSHTDQDPNKLYKFDEGIEGISEADGVTIGVRQRWQTKRGAGKTRRTVDFLTLDTEVGIFNDAPGTAITNGYASSSRPERSIARNFLNSSLIWRLNDRTALLSELNYDLNDGELDVLNVSFVSERSPRFSYLLGYRFIEESSSNLLGFDLNYRLTEKHTLAVRELFDFDEGRTLDFTVVLIRKFPRWFSALSFELDEAEDDFGVSISIWPEGLSQAALGSRRFTGLAQTTSLTRD